jgi:hypothetical protein
MSDWKIIRALLVADANLTAVVAAEKIVAGTLKQTTTLPAISIQSISSMENEKISDKSSTVMMTSRVQVTVHATSLTQQAAVLALVGRAIRGGRRVVAGVQVLDIQRDIIGPDMSDVASSIFQQTRDFRVKYLFSLE